jgi:hypothetical protein
VKVAEPVLPFVEVIGGVILPPGVVKVVDPTQFVVVDVLPVGVVTLHVTEFVGGQSAG